MRLSRRYRLFIKYVLTEKMGNDEKFLLMYMIKTAKKTSSSFELKIQKLIATTLRKDK